MSRWLRSSEVGAAWGLALLVWLATSFGRRAPRVLLPFVAFYYVVFHRAARRASRRYWQRLGWRGDFVTVYRHVLRFAQCIVDRLFFLRGDLGPFRITRTGNELLERIVGDRKGAILLGAHLGSFEALRASAIEEAYPIHVLGNFRNAPLINAFLDRVGDNSRTRFVDLGESPMKTAMLVRDIVARGEMVAILADRVGEGPSASVEFLGARAAFPTGPFALAAALGCPVYLTFGLYHAPDRYELYCERFADRIVAHRRERSAALQRWAQAYAQRLEHYCRLAPDNWFNFYEFWEGAEAAPAPVTTPGSAGPS